MSTGSKETMPSWLLSIRRATGEEDLDGVDAVVSTTDVGDLLVQIKSSEGGAAFFKDSEHWWPARHIVVVVVLPYDTHEEIIRKTRKLLGNLRQEILKGWK